LYRLYSSLYIVNYDNIIIVKHVQYIEYREIGTQAPGPLCIKYSSSVYRTNALYFSTSIVGAAENIGGRKWSIFDEIQILYMYFFKYRPFSTANILHTSVHTKECEKM
jgi:hypothetical protein